MISSSVGISEIPGRNSLSLNGNKEGVLEPWLLSAFWKGVTFCRQDNVEDPRRQLELSSRGRLVTAVMTEVGGVDDPETGAGFVDTK